MSPEVIAPYVLLPPNHRSETVHHYWKMVIHLFAVKPVARNISKPALLVGSAIKNKIGSLIPAPVTVLIHCIRQKGREADAQ